MIAFSIGPPLFSALRAGFEAAAYSVDAPISLQLLNRLRPKMAGAAARSPRGKPILMMLESTEELYALGDCFAVGGEGHPDVTSDQWEAINALIDAAALSAPS
jgi:hypothetical protein